MTRQEIAGLACKLMALYLFVHGAIGGVQFLIAMLPVIGDAVSVGFDWQRFGPLATAGSYVASLFAPAALLWWKTEYFSRRMVVDDPAPVTSREWNAETLTSIGLVVLGMNVVINALRSLLTLVLSVVGRQASLGDLIDSQWGVPIAIDLCFALLGFWLMLGSAGISRLILRLRTGRPGSPHEPLETRPPDDRS